MGGRPEGRAAIQRDLRDL